jgi:hypothetical protein
MELNIVLMHFVYVRSEWTQIRSKQIKVNSSTSTYS